MPLLTGPALLAAALLIVAGAQKVLDPTMTVGALRALGLPVRPASVRAASLAELAVGVVAVTVGGSPVWAAVAASYLGFNAVVIAALRSGTMIGSCGCFGREETPPHWSHVALNVVLAGVASAAALTGGGAPLDDVIASSGEGSVVLVLTAIALYLLYALYVELPRTLLARSQRNQRASGLLEGS
ncbi:MAG: MauE/DoxX family redox-associated membrane protein [Microthrixaceae bacterium]